MSEIVRSGRHVKGSPVLTIDTHEQAIREYLNSLDNPPLAKGFNPAEVVDGIDDPIAKLRALADAKRRSEVNELEARFIEVAARWAARNGVGREAFVALGVPSRVLKQAFGGEAKRGGTQRARVSLDALTAGITAKVKGSKFTVAGISDEIGGSAATVRRVLDQLTNDGVVINNGPDPEYGGRGRAPLIFQRA